MIQIAPHRNPSFTFKVPSALRTVEATITAKVTIMASHTPQTLTESKKWHVSRIDDTEVSVVHASFIMKHMTLTLPLWAFPLQFCVYTGVPEFLRPMDAERLCSACTGQGGGAVAAGKPSVCAWCSMTLHVCFVTIMGWLQGLHIPPPASAAFHTFTMVPDEAGIMHLGLLGPEFTHVDVDGITLQLPRDTPVIPPRLHLQAQKGEQAALPLPVEGKLDRSMVRLEKVSVGCCRVSWLPSSSTTRCFPSSIVPGGLVRYRWLRATWWKTCSAN